LDLDSLQNVFQSQTGSRSTGDIRIVLKCRQCFIVSIPDGKPLHWRLAIGGVDDSQVGVSIPDGKPLHWRPGRVRRRTFSDKGFNPRREAAPLATRFRGHCCLAA